MGPLVFVLIIMAAAAQCKDPMLRNGMGFDGMGSDGLGWVMGPRPRGVAFVTGELYGSVTVAFNVAASV